MIEDAIRRHRLIAILRGVPLARVMRLGEVLASAGIRVLEVAIGQDEDYRAIAQLREALRGEVQVGAGTVVSEEVARRALDAGAGFLITPHLAPEVHAFARARGVSVIGGAFSPAELAAARQHSSQLVKLFPAAAVGPGYITALQGPYPDLEVVAVGGVSAENAAEYLRAGAVAVGVGGALTRLPQGGWDEAPLRQRAQTLVAATAAPLG